MNSVVQKIKDLFSKIVTYIVLALGGAVAILLYILNVRNKQLESAQSRIALIQTQKDADLIEADIKQKLAETELNKQDREALQKSLGMLEQKRQSLKDPRTTDEEKTDYWNKS